MRAAAVPGWRRARSGSSVTVSRSRWSRREAQTERHRDSPTPAGAAAVGRRSLLRRVALVAGGAIGAVVARGSPAQAAAGEPLVIGSANFAEDQETSLRSDGKGLTLYIEGRGSGLSAAAFGGPGITGWSFLSHAVVATTDNDNDFNAVFARSGGGGSAVYGEQGNRHSHTHGVYGKSEGSGNGVLGVAASGAGVSGTSDTGRGGLFQSGS